MNTVMGAKSDTKQNLEVEDNQVTVGNCFTDAPKMTMTHGSLSGLTNSETELEASLFPGITIWHAS